MRQITEAEMLRLLDEICARELSIFERVRLAFACGRVANVVDPGPASNAEVARAYKLIDSVRK